MGASADEVRSAEAWDETRALVGTFRSICGDGSTAEGLAALYSYESQIPAVATSKIDGLRRFYGMDEPRALAYFIVHEQADREHSAVERRLLAKHAPADNTQEVKDASARSLDALWEMLSGVCRRHGIAC